MDEPHAADRADSADPAAVVVSCDPAFDASHLLAGTRVEACVRVDADTPGVPLTWRARAVLDGDLHTLNISDLPSWGAVGCALSHIRLWQRLVDAPSSFGGSLAGAADDEDQASLVVFEDDAVLTRPPAHVARLVRAAHAELAGGFDVLLLGYRLTLDTLFERRTARASPSFSWLVAPRWYETHAYAITRRGARLLLAHALPVSMQIDAFMATARNALGLRFAVPRGAPVARQRRSILHSSVQARDLMAHCAFCRLPPPLRNGWAALTLLAGLVGLVVVVALYDAKRLRIRPTPIHGALIKDRFDR